MIRTAVKVDGIRMIVQDSMDGKNNRVTPDSPHSQYAIQRSDVHAELTAVRTIANVIRGTSGPLKSVVELFGGSGWHSALIDRVCRPMKHIAWDYAEDCVSSIKLSLPHVEAILTDSYRTPVPSSQWVHCDFNNLTFHRYQEQDLTKQLVRSAALAATEWLTITDSALFGLVRFVKNRESYAKLQPGVVEDYWRYFDLWAEEIGMAGGGKRFKLLSVWSWSSMAAMMLFRREDSHLPYLVSKVKPEVEVQILGPVP